MVCPNPGGVTGRSLGRCKTAAFTCGGSLVAAALFVLFELFALLIPPLVELLADCPWLSVGGFCTRESVRNPPLV
jgi:hypothetical protein